MNSLAAILEHKRAEVRSRKEEVPIEALPPSKFPTFDFVSALRKPCISVIAEIKRRSPSRGLIAGDADAAELAANYQRGGASALSVLTDERFFGGKRDDIAAAKRAASLPVLRKDFIIDAYQIHESVCLGADAVLLIAAALSDQKLVEFIELAGEIGLQALVEAHTEYEIQRAVAGGATIIGVNNRDLATMVVDLSVCIKLRKTIPEHCLAVAESGIRSRDDVAQIARAGYDAVLMGEALMESDDPVRRLEDLMVGGPRAQKPWDGSPVLGGLP